VAGKKKIRPTSNPWERITHGSRIESPRAYSYFCVYRDMGPERSIPKAFTLFKAPRQTSSKVVTITQSSADGNANSFIRSGYWFELSSRFKWTKRAGAWDDDQERIKREAKVEAIRQAERRQATQAKAAGSIVNVLQTALLRKVQADPKGTGAYGFGNAGSRQAGPGVRTRHGQHHKAERTSWWAVQAGSGRRRVQSETFGKTSFSWGGKELRRRKSKATARLRDFAVANSSANRPVAAIVPEERHVKPLRRSLSPLLSRRQAGFKAFQPVFLVTLEELNANTARKCFAFLPCGVRFRECHTVDKFLEGGSKPPLVTPGLSESGSTARRCLQNGRPPCPNRRKSKGSSGL
jgi:hypothetical protein